MGFGSGGIDGWGFVVMLDVMRRLAFGRAGDETFRLHDARKEKVFQDELLLERVQVADEYICLG
jgi:hypothetical protein